jgi:UDP-2,4-diacetamido-2,4,6-trideoxy-beta-L-altropyranose hydrolase
VASLVKKCVVIRADASIEIGAGHIARSLALAKRLKDDGATVIFIVRSNKGDMVSFIQEQGFQVKILLHHKLQVNSSCLSGYHKWLGVTQEEDAKETTLAIRDMRVSWLVVDHYAIDERWESLLRPYVDKIMVVDDLANRRHDCDLLLDQNYRQEYTVYDQLIPVTSLRYLGPQFTLLREEFSSESIELRQRPDFPKRIFIFFGGGDPHGLTSITLAALDIKELGSTEIDVVVGGSCYNLSEIVEYSKQRDNITLHIQVDNIAQIMAAADLAIGAGGSTTWERMIVGLPSLVVTLAENQVSPVKSLAAENYLTWLGDRSQVDATILRRAVLDACRNYPALRELAQLGRTIVGSDGSAKIAKILVAGPNLGNLCARRATFGDCLLYWYWANDLLVRQSAFNSKPIELEEHQGWFKRQLHSNRSHLLVVECDSGPVGQVRFEHFDDKKLRISYSIGRLYRGLGLGGELLSAAISLLELKGPVQLFGEVKNSNIASLRVFEKLGFKQVVSLSDANMTVFIKDLPQSK